MRKHCSVWLRERHERDPMKHGAVLAAAKLLILDLNLEFLKNYVHQNYTFRSLHLKTIHLCIKMASMKLYTLAFI